MKEIRKDDQEFDFEASVGSRNLVRTLNFDKVHAVTMKGKRFVLNPMPEAPTGGTDVEGNTVRSAQQIDALINTVGSA